jgi:prephenate dehydrogenase
MLRIAIVGMGLIGTSLGMALRNADTQATPAGEIYVTGYDQDSRATSAARDRLAIDRKARSLEEVAAEAHVVVLATPVRAMRELLATLAPLLGKGSVVSDVASTKAQVCEWARELLPAHVNFVGGHPLAGREQSGAGAADPALFQGAIYCLTPDPRASQQALQRIERLVLAVGAKPYYIDPHEHDAYVAGVSHLPFVLSAALMRTASHSPAWREMSLLASSGFRDVSRLASGDPLMHRDICLTNPAALTRWIDEVMGVLAEVRTMLGQEDAERLEAFLRDAQQQRDTWLANTPDTRPGEEQYTQGPPVERGFLGLPKPFRRNRGS